MRILYLSAYFLNLILHELEFDPIKEPNEFLPVYIIDLETISNYISIEKNLNVKTVLLFRC